MTPRTKEPLALIRAAAIASMFMLPAAASHGADEPLTLVRAVDLALSNNERAVAADAQFEAARARVSKARSFFFPDLTLNSTYTRRRYASFREINGETVTIQSQNAQSSTVNLNSPLFDARAFPLYRQAKFERESVRFGTAETKRILAFEAADAFVGTLSVEQVHRAAERRRDFAKTSLDDARARFDAGLVSSNDVTKAELELATAQLALERAAGDVQQAYLQLGNLLNSEVEGPLVPPAGLLDAASQPPAVTSGDIDSAIDRRYDLSSTRQHVAALREFAKEPSRRWIPTLNLSAQFRRTNEAGLSGRENDGNASVLFSWAAFDGGDRRADTAERNALVRAAEASLQATERLVGVQLKSAVVDLQSEQASIRQAEAAANAARRNADETTELYRQGLASALEVADANVRLFEAEIADVRARYQLALAYLNLRAATGLDPLGRKLLK